MRRACVALRLRVSIRAGRLGRRSRQRGRLLGRFWGIPLVAFLANGMNLPDTSFAKDLTRGMELAGEIPATNTLRPRTRVPSEDHTDRARRIPVTNAAAFGRVMGKQGSAGALARWNLPL